MLLFRSLIAAFIVVNKTFRQIGIFRSVYNFLNKQYLNIMITNTYYIINYMLFQIIMKISLIIL